MALLTTLMCIAWICTGISMGATPHITQRRGKVSFELAMGLLALIALSGGLTVLFNRQYKEDIQSAEDKGRESGRSEYRMQSSGVH